MSESSGRWVRWDLLLWLVPPVFCWWFFRRGLLCWFQADDFSLLLLAMLPEQEFWEEFWQPRAQGTFRWLSERLYFYLFYDWFGLNAFPYRVLVFFTQGVNLILLFAVTKRLTGNRWAGFVAACVWALHHSLSISLSWSSGYNQVLCSFFFLLSFWLFLQYRFTGQKLYYLAQWGTFLLGFAALETMVVYPVVLLAYALLLEPRSWTRAAPMLLGSAGLVWWQLQASPPAQTGTYQPHWDASLLESLGVYSRWVLSPALSSWMAVLFCAVALGLTLYHAFRGDRKGLFFIAWFIITLAPYLPFRAHRSEYYLVIPSIALSMMAGWFLLRAARSHAVQLAMVTIWLAALFFYSTQHARQVVKFYESMSHSAKALVSNAAQLRQRHPNKIVLLANIPEALIYRTVYHEVFRAIGVFNVYLTPETQQLTQPLEGFDDTQRFFYSPRDTQIGLRRRVVVVYDLSGPEPVNVTEAYRRLAPLKGSF